MTQSATTEVGMANTSKDLNKYKYRSKLTHLFLQI